MFTAWYDERASDDSCIVFKEQKVNHALRKMRLFRRVEFLVLTAGERSPRLFMQHAHTSTVNSMNWKRIGQVFLYRSYV